MWTGLGSNLTLWGEMHMRDCLNHGVTKGFLYELQFG
jgi:hypothetical protein